MNCYRNAPPTSGTLLRQVLDLLLGAALFVLLMAWCVGCMAVPLWAVGLLPVYGVAERALAIFAAGGGLVFSLWTVSKVTRSKL